jgi:hypothetical protein
LRGASSSDVASSSGAKAAPVGTAETSRRRLDRRGRVLAGEFRHFKHTPLL